MKTLYKFILKSYAGPMFLTLFIVVFIFLMQFLWLYIDELAGKGLAWHVLLEFIGWLSITFIPMSLPLAVLLASLMVMGDLGENNELLALKASGISLRRILMPLYGAIFFIAIGSFFMSSNFVPYSYLRMRSMFQDIRKTRPELSIPVGIFYNGIDGFSIRVNDKDPVTGVLRGVMIYDHSKEAGNTSVTMADSGYIRQTSNTRHIVFKLLNGEVYEDELKGRRIDKERHPFNRRTFTEQTVLIDMGEQIGGGSNDFLFKEVALAQSLQSLNMSRDSISKLQARNLEVFQTQHFQNSYSFAAYRELDTAVHVRNAFLYSSSMTDSLFAHATATEKIRILEKASVTSERVNASWDNWLREMEGQRKKLNSLNLEWHRKFTLALACIIFFFIGAPLGAIIRKGGLGTPVVVSVFFFVVYWVIDSICQKMVKSNVWYPIVGAWLPSLILSPMAVFLTYKANTDSQLFNPDNYWKFFNRILGRMEKLVERINLDYIKTLGKEAFVTESTLVEEHLVELNNVCTVFLEQYKPIGFFQKRKELNEAIQRDLGQIVVKYNRLLSFLVSIDDNERLRTFLRDYPVLETAKYKIPVLNTLKRVLMVLLFPWGIAEFLFQYNKQRQLRFILKEIITINNNVIKAL